MIEPESKMRELSKKTNGKAAANVPVEYRGEKTDLATMFWRGGDKTEYVMSGPLQDQFEKLAAMSS